VKAVLLLVSLPSNMVIGACRSLPKVPMLHLGARSYLLYSLWGLKYQAH